MNVKQDFDRISEMLSALIEGTDAAQLDDSTPCSDFAVRDLIGHFTLGRFLFAAGFAADKERGDELLAGMPARMGDVVASGHKETYRDASERLEQALGGFPDLDQPVSLVFGEMPGSYALQMLSADNFIHCWDLATATGQQFDPPEDLVESTPRSSRVSSPMHRAMVALLLLRLRLLMIRHRLIGCWACAEGRRKHSLYMMTTPSDVVAALFEN